MKNAIIQHYMKLTEFLGSILGPDYEVALHDVTTPEQSIVAIANGHVSGRTIGAPLTEHGRQMIREKAYETSESLINYTGVAMENGNMLRSSIFFVKDQKGALIAMLCVNFDDYRYRDLSDRLLKLCHPDSFVDSNFVFNEELARAEAVPGPGSETFTGSVTLAIEEAVNEVIQDSGIPLERLTKDEKIQIISILNKKGIFQLKNAVKQVAKQIHSSQASVYRYINMLDES